MPASRRWSRAAFREATLDHPSADSANVESGINTCDKVRRGGAGLCCRDFHMHIPDPLRPGSTFIWPVRMRGMDVIKGELSVRSGAEVYKFILGEKL